MADEPGAVGAALQNLPIRQMLRDLALGISDAQQELDLASIAAMKRVTSEGSGVKGDDGKELNLLEAGFVPSFYQFREATIDLSFSLSMHVEQSTSIGVNLHLSHESSSEM